MSPLKVAIVGGGPSAFYVASRLLQLLPASDPVGASLRIHIFDRLWAPHGLVRYGVAPDHPEVKNCTHKFDEAGHDPRLQFFGNVNIGSSPSFIPHAVNVDLEKLFPHYTHMVLAPGCTVPRLHSSLPPSERCRPAISLVHWYTLHPSLPKPPPLENTTHVTVVGHGNVSLDIARILLCEPAHLSKYDVPQSVLDLLETSSIKHVSIVGRRGPLEASFTTKELRELMNLPNASLAPIDKSTLTPNPDRPLTRQQSRLMTLLQQGSKNKFGTTDRTWSLDFFRSPTGVSRLTNSDTSSQVHLAHTTLDANLKAVPTGETTSLTTDLIVTSLGYTSEPSQKWYEPGLGHLRNVQGRVIDASGRLLKNVYASGWAATGAKGVLASTLMNAHAVVDTLLSDLLPGSEVVTTGPSVPISKQENTETENVLNSGPDPDDIPPEIRDAQKSGQILDYSDWKRIDQEEIRRGLNLGKERERMGWDDAKRYLLASNR